VITRRVFSGGLAAFCAGPALAQHAGHDPVYSYLNDARNTAAPTEIMWAQQMFDSPALAATLQGRWIVRAPLPTAHSGHGAVLYRDRIFVMGGEDTNRVFGQNQDYDLAADRWESYAPMTTPRHGLGAVAIGDFIYSAGGGPIMGGSSGTRKGGLRNDAK
jgi:hypothetical protein